MSLWQFHVAAVGWAKQFEGGSMSEGDADELWAWLQEKNDVPLSHRRPN